MTDESEKLTDADTADLVGSLSFALRYEGRKRVHSGDEMMARITAERLVEHLRKSGFVVKKKPPAPLHSAPGPNKHLTE